MTNAPTRALQEGRYGFDTVALGDQITTGSAEMTAEMIDTFADLSGDRFAIHMEDAAARSKGFDGRVAHGLLVLSLIDGLKNQTPAQFDAIASLGWDWQFRRPVLIGDVLKAVITVVEKRETSDLARGILRLDFRVTNQEGELVQSGSNLLMVHR